MEKSYWFQHDYNASNDVKLLAVRGKFGCEGLGWYWMMLESMAQNGGYIMATLLGGLCLGYSLPIATLLDFMKFCVEIDLFKENEQGYYSSRLLTHFSTREALKSSGKRGAEVRWARKKMARPIADKRREDKKREYKEDNKNIKTNSDSGDLSPTPKLQMEDFIKSVNEKNETYQQLLEELSAKNPSFNFSAELDKFIAYWTELNSLGTKQRWQSERFFDVRRRLATWFSRASSFTSQSRGAIIS